MMGGLWKQVGLKGAPVRLVGHAIAQVHYDGDWHVMDGDLGMIYLLRDNETLASDRQLARDHDLVKRTHTMGILVDDSRMRDERAAAMFVSEEPIQGSRACKEDTTMKMTLRPGEALVWRWGHLKPAKYMSAQPIPLPGQHLQRPVGIPAGLRRRGVEEGRDEDRERRLRPRGSGGGKRQDGHGRLEDHQPLRLRRRASRSGRQRGEVCRFVRRQEMDGHRGQQLRQVLSAGRQSVLPVPTALRTARRSQIEATGGHQRPANGPARAARDDRRREQLHLHRQVVRRAEGADHTRVGGAIHQQAAGGPGGGLSARWRPGRGHGLRFPLERAEGPRRRQDHRLPLHARQPARHAVAAVDELRQAHLADGGQGQGAIHACPARAC